MINNAGIGVAGGMLATSAAHWERIVGANLWGAVHGCRLFGAQMAELGRGGHLVNIVSAAAYAPSRTYPAYATTKAATLMLSACVRAELAPYGIGVSAVCPGFVHTGIVRSAVFAGTGQAHQARLRARAERLYRLRGLPPERVARAILKAIRKNRPVVHVGLEALGVYGMSRLSPGLQRVGAKLDATRLIDDKSSKASTVSPETPQEEPCLHPRHNATS